MSLYNVSAGLDPYWISGFTDGEGCFSVGLFRNKTMRLGFQIQLEFCITQHKRDHSLLLLFPSFFGCGYVAPDGSNKFKFIVRDLSHLNSIVIPFFLAYPLRTTKSLDFQDFAAVAAMMSRGEHLTEQGLAKIQEIKSSMNRGRKC